MSDEKSADTSGPVSDSLQNLGTTATVVKELIQVAGNNEHTAEAGRQLGKAALTVSETVNTLLLPFAAVNYGVKKAKAYFTEKFEIEIKDKLGQIPPENVIEPKASIAAPTIQALAYSHEEIDLKEMYLNLLSTAMDDRHSQDAHPAFVEIVKQMTSEDATIAKLLLPWKTGIPIARIKLEFKPEGNYRTLLNHLLNGTNNVSGAVESPRLPVTLDNFIRLGLITIDYTSRVHGDENYDWVENRPEVLRYKAKHAGEDAEVTHEKGILEITAFGRQFSEAVGLSNAGDS